MTAKMNIYQKINAVQKKVNGYIQKDSVISGAGSYRAVSHDHVVSKVRDSMVEFGIVSYPVLLEGSIIIERNVEKQIKQHLYQGEYSIQFVNIDDPSDFVSVRVQAHAADNGDKAPGKAVTYATKTAMLKIFNFVTGEDEENRFAEPETEISEQEVKQIKTALAASGVDEAEFLKKAQVNSITEIHPDRFAAAMGWISKQAKKESSND